MSTAPSQHLNETQVDDAILGDLAAGPAAHLAGCADCQQSVALASAPIAGFKAVTLAWAERRSATVPAQIVLAPTSPWGRRLGIASAATGVLALAFGFSLAREAHGNSGTESATATQQAATTVAPSAFQSTVAAALAATGMVAPAPQTASRHKAARPSTDDEIARDNQMLEAIDHELDAAVQPEAETFGLETVSTSSRAVFQPATLRN